jgi:hypothetical protein
MRLRPVGPELDGQLILLGGAGGLPLRRVEVAQEEARFGVAGIDRDRLEVFALRGCGVALPLMDPPQPGMGRRIVGGVMAMACWYDSAAAAKRSWL